MTTVKVYLAGPMRGIAEYNFPAFREATDYLRGKKYEVFNPAERDESVGLDVTGMTGTENLEDGHGFSVREALNADLAWITSEADCIVVLDGWENSSGARAETMTAVAIGIPVFSYTQMVNNRPEGSLMFKLTTEMNKYDKPIDVKFQIASAIAAERGETVVKETISPLDVKLVNLPPLSSGITYRTAGLADRSDDEVRATDPASGASKGRKPIEMGAIDPLARIELARVAAMGSEKYGRYNYLSGKGGAHGFPFSWAIDAAHRHLMELERGVNRDDESGLCHGAHFAWQGLCLTSYILRGYGTDDRLHE